MMKKNFFGRIKYNLRYDLFLFLIVISCLMNTEINSTWPYITYITGVHNLTL